LKASLKLVAIEYPKKHDVSDILISVKNRFPEWFQNEISFLANTSKTLSKKREISMYGNEELGLAPDELISKEEAKNAVEMAKKVYSLCKKLIEIIKI
jgi:HEPN domain-containing protein